MSKTEVALLILASSVALVQSSACDRAVIEKIKTIWDGKPPTDILKRTVGIQTNLYIPSFMQNRTDGLECFQTYLDTNETTAVDIYYYRDPRDTFGTNEYNMVVKEPGVITLLDEDNDIILDYLYVVYLDDDVIGYYQCGDVCPENKLECTDYDPFLEVATIAGKNPAESAESIGKATELLKTLGLEFTTLLESDACFIDDDDSGN